VKFNGTPRAFCDEQVVWTKTLAIGGTRIHCDVERETFRGKIMIRRIFEGLVVT
jgi:hypothetical protein